MTDGISRRRALSTLTAGGVAIAAIAATASAQDAPAASKQSQADAQYQDKPKNGQLCGICTYFVAPSSCQKVDGEIHPTGWCKNFQLKS